MAEAARTKIDRTRYETMLDRDMLARWIAAASEQGFVAIDLVTTSPDPMIAEIIGVSLALGPDKACYVPLSHRASDDLLAGGGLVRGQVTIGDALAQLKPLLESAGVLKIGHDLKGTCTRSSVTASSLPRSTMCSSCPMCSMPGSAGIR